MSAKAIDASLCPLCGWPLDRFDFTSTPGASNHRGQQCANCGYATCSYGSLLSEIGDRLLGLPHLQLHVPREFRTFVRWVPDGASWRPWRSSRRPWWPNGRAVRRAGLTTEIAPAVRSGQLFWIRIDYPSTWSGPALITPARYPSFRLALTATAEEQNAVARVQSEPPAMMLLPPPDGDAAAAPTGKG